MEINRYGCLTELNAIDTATLFFIFLFFSPSRVEKYVTYFTEDRYFPFTVDGRI